MKRIAEVLIYKNSIPYRESFELPDVSIEEFISGALKNDQLFTWTLDNGVITDHANFSGCPNMVSIWTHYTSTDEEKQKMKELDVWDKYFREI